MEGRESSIDYAASLREGEKQDAVMGGGEHDIEVPIALQNQDLMRFQMIVKDILEMVSNLLRRKVKIGKEVISAGKPILNEEGIATILLAIHARINKNTFMSNLDEDLIKKIVMEVGFHLNNILFLYWDRSFNMDIGYYSEILWEIIDIVEIGLRRAMGGEERRLSLSTVKTTQIVGDMRAEGSESQSIWKKLNPFGGG